MSAVGNDVDLPQSTHYTRGNFVCRRPPVTGKVQTVLGPIEPDDIGLTSMHEHIIIDFTVVFQGAEEASQKHKAYEPITIKNLGWVRYDPFRSHENLQLTDEDTAVAEIALYGRSGGGTICDVTTVGIRRDPVALANISRATGVNIVCGAGYYIGPSHPTGMDNITVEELEEEFVADVTTGIGTTGVKAGLIGELGCGWPLGDNERKVLMAAGRAQSRTGASILIHPGRSPDAPFEVMDILEGEGADPTRVVMGHIGRTYTTLEPILKLAERGCYLEYDQFGLESSYFSYGVTQFPSDGTRLNFIKDIVDAGYGDRVVVGQDVFGKHQLKQYGGYGYAHLIDNIVPRLHERLTDEQVNAIMVENPKRVLTLVDHTR